MDRHGCNWDEHSRQCESVKRIRSKPSKNRQVLTSSSSDNINADWSRCIDRAVLLIFRNQYPSLFVGDEDVIILVKELTPILALSIVISNVQPVLSGVAVGAGWQAVVAYVNIACYYLFGIPFGLLSGTSSTLVLAS
ncbi:unnamed protein product, partial [Brassica oleracea]